MPKPSYNISPITISELKNEVLKMASFPIRTKADAGYLALLMKRNGVDGVSESTIVRFLNQSKNDHKFYLNTLDKFAVFCGRKDFDDFEKWLKNESEIGFSYGKIRDVKNQTKSLIKICLYQKQYKPIREYVEQFEDLSIDSQLRLGFEFYQSLLTNSSSNIRFYKDFSHIKVIRESFFERCFDPDFNIPDYEIGFNYYLKNINPEQSKSQLQDYIFGNCVLLRHYYIKKNYNKAIKHASNLYLTYDFNNNMDTLFIYPKMRYLSYRILYFKLINDQRKLLDQVKEILYYCKDNANNSDYFEQRIVFSCIADTFILAGVGEKYKLELKNTFSELLKSYSDDFLNHSLNYVLKYTDMNGIRTFKTISRL